MIEEINKRKQNSKPSIYIKSIKILYEKMIALKDLNIEWIQKINMETTKQTRVKENILVNCCRFDSIILKEGYNYVSNVRLVPSFSSILQNFSHINAVEKVIKFLAQ